MVKPILLAAVTFGGSLPGAVIYSFRGTTLPIPLAPVQVGYSAKSGPVYLPAAYAGAQGQYAGLDQVNVLLPASLDTSITMWLNVDGVYSNPVTLTFQ